MIKLLVSDMDGTLFNSDQEISPYNLAAIRQAQKNGVRFMIATGRNIDTIGPTLEKYDLNCGLILMNGAEIRDENLNIISTINIDQNIIPSLANQLEEMGYIPEYMTNHYSQICCTEEKMDRNMGYRMMSLDRDHLISSIEEAIEIGKKSIFKRTLERNDSLEDFLAKNLEIRKIIVFHPDGEQNKKNRFELQKQFPELSILSSYPDNIEINSIHAQKGYGLQKAIEKMSIAKEEVAIFGDGYNDLSLFELFSNSYATANAQPEIKEKAKEIIPSNNENGVGIKINELLFQNKMNSKMDMVRS